MDFSVILAHSGRASWGNNKLHWGVLGD